MGSMLSPDKSAQKAAAKQRATAEAENKRLQQERQAQERALRLRQRGRQSLIRNVGGELGVRESLGE